LRIATWGGLASLLLLGACSPIFLDEESGPTGGRRLYVNDKAPNDSLSRGILDDGLRFVMQPGKTYELSVATARTGDILDVYAIGAGGSRAYASIPAVHDGARQIFSLSSDAAAGRIFVARLLTGGDPTARGAVGRVALSTADTLRADTLRVKLIFVRGIDGLSTDAAKSAYAKSLFDYMNSLLNAQGIVVAGRVQVVDGSVAPLAFPFSDTYYPLPGNREPNHAHLYLVNRIEVTDPETGPQGEVLGFAPREVVNLSEHRESRVVLAMRSSARELAITATHELGHFFGLRHTVSSYHDKLQDMDDSNVEDGFTDTPYCGLDVANPVAKSSAPDEGADAPAHPAYPPGSAGPYCLRIANNSCSALQCDIRNLMHPVECGSNQTAITPQQALFLKKNMALYKL
jgi:hypothetical protein